MKLITRRDHNKTFGHSVQNVYPNINQAKSITPAISEYFYNDYNSSLKNNVLPVFRTAKGNFNVNKKNDDKEIIKFLTSKNLSPQEVSEKFLDIKFKQKFKSFVDSETSKRITELKLKANMAEQEKIELEGLQLLKKDLFDDSKKKSLKLTKNGLYSKQISFKGGNLLTDQQFCHAIIHSASAICSGISYAHADASAWGLDAWALRGTQSLMFTVLADRLNAPVTASVIYGVKEFYSGANVGIKTSKMLVGMAGIGAHTAATASGTTLATGGTAHAGISGTVGAINGSLSAFITEKMGWGFVNRIKANKMKWQTQLRDVAAYATKRSIINVGLEELDHSSEAIHRLMSNCPERSKAFLGMLYDHIHEAGIDTDLGRFLINLSGEFSSKLILNSGDLSKENGWSMIKNSLINTASYDIAGRALEEGANARVIAERTRIENMLNSSPTALQGLMREIKYSDLNELMEAKRDTIDKFKDKNNFKVYQKSLKNLMKALDKAVTKANKSLKEAAIEKIEEQKFAIKEEQLKPKL